MKKHLINCHPGELRNLFLEGAREGKLLEENRQIITTSPLNGGSHGKSDD